MLQFTFIRYGQIISSTQVLIFRACTHFEFDMFVAFRFHPFKDSNHTWPKTARYNTRKDDADFAATHITFMSDIIALLSERH